MALTDAQLDTLKTELEGDPRSYGYAQHITAGSDNVLAEMLNLVRAITIRRKDIASQDLYSAIAVADYTALPANPNATQLSAERRFLAWLSGISAFKSIRLQNDDGTDTPVVTNLLAMFPAGSGTRTRINALATRQGSRAEEMFGADVVITDEEVGWALRGGAP